MTPEQLKRWRKEILARLDILKSMARQAQQYLEANNLNELKDTGSIRDAWLRVRERLPEDLKPPRVTDLNRHLGFAMPHDFCDIETLDIPAIEAAIERYGRHGDEFIEYELTTLNVDLETWELLHPQIRDACMAQYENGLYRDAARAAVELLLDEVRRCTGRQDDGDALIRGAVGVARQIGFSTNADDNEKSITDGLKLVLKACTRAFGIPPPMGTTVSCGWKHSRF